MHWHELLERIPEAALKQLLRSQTRKGDQEEDWHDLAAALLQSGVRVVQLHPRHWAVLDPDVLSFIREEPNPRRSQETTAR